MRATHHGWPEKASQVGGQEHEWAELSGCGEQVGRVVGYMSEGAVGGAATTNTRTGDSGRGNGHSSWREEPREGIGTTHGVQLVSEQVGRVCGWDAAGERVGRMHGMQ